MALTKLSSKLTSFLNKLLPSAKTVSLYSRNAADASMFDFIPEEYHEGIMNHTETRDLSAYMQAAINDMDARGGGVIRVPPGQYYCNLVTKPHVVLLGARYNSTRRSLFWTYNSVAGAFTTRLRNYNNDWIIKSETNISGRGFGLVGIDFDAKDASNSTGGVYLRGPEAIIKCCSAYGFQDQGFKMEGNINTIEDVIANECLKQRTRYDYVGTIEVSGADCHISRVEGNAQCVGLGTIHNAEPYLCGIKIAGNNSYVYGLMGEISETGVYIRASNAIHKMSNSRADNNTGPGFLLDGVMMDNCHSYNNSRNGEGQYSGFKSLPNASRVFASNCVAWTDAFPVDGTKEQRKHKYGFDFSTMDYVSPRLKSWQNQCFSYGHSEGEFLDAPTNGAIRSVHAAHTVHNTTATVIPVDNISLVAIKGNSGSTITGFSGGYIGQEVCLYLDAQKTVTLVHSGTFQVNNNARNANKVMEVGRTYRFIKTRDTIWREVGDVTRWLAGNRASRPSSSATPGMMYFDTDLGKPIWRGADNNSWVDATGTSV